MMDLNFGRLNRDLRKGWPVTSFPVMLGLFSMHKWLWSLGW